MRSFRVLRLIGESLLFAAQALRSNLLRTTLSLLGVSIGIFAIVGVFTIVDSLERKIRSDMAFIGDDVIYIQKFPWGFGSSDYPWWKYLARPANTVEEFRFLEKNLKSAKAVALLLQRGQNNVRFQNRRIESVFLTGTTQQYPLIQELEIDQGRFFTASETESGRNVAVIGAEIAEALFYNQSPLGKSVKIRGLPFTIVGTMKKEGTNLFGFSPRDTQVIIPFGAFGKMYRIGNQAVEPTIALKAYPEDVDYSAIEGEVKGLLRSKRGLKPREEDDFALNRTEAFANAIGALFSVLSLAGSVIGSFSILVGGFGIANIMFVSVKERTSLIGIQKSLGAKNYFILFQFLFEAIFLSLIGGGVGLLLVYLISLIPFGFFDLVLSYKNILVGVLVSSVIGLVSGVVPAYMAARMDPVEAIRS
ncbi:MAG: FtsX-like permease family protein [Microscillaceae bacterium]|nr:FtsX-like permease family protein [Microscillaceae bacterium]